MIALIWNWYEVVEGASVTIAFASVPFLWRLEKHRKASEKRHTEMVEMHKKTHDRLGIK